MNAHATADWVKRRWYGTTIAACVICLLIGTGLAMVIGRTQPGPYWLIYCGNTQGQGECAPDFVNGGWVAEGRFTAIQWTADISQGTARETNDAMAAGHAAYNQHCGGGNCIIAGFSLGNGPALQLAAEVGLAPENTYLFGAPQPSTGVFHNAYPDNPLVEGWFDTFSALATDRPVAAGAQAFYNTRDPYANAAPQCAGPGLFALGLDGHYVISRAEADQHVWTGPDGVVMHEAGYVPAPGLPSSGSDPSPLWAGCPPGGYYSPSVTPVGPGPVPFVPGSPNPQAPGSDLPGLPGGGIPTAIPSQLPGLPGVGG